MLSNKTHNLMTLLIATKENMEMHPNISPIRLRWYKTSLIIIKIIINPSPPQLHIKILHLHPCSILRSSSLTSSSPLSTFELNLFSFFPTVLAILSVTSF
jgi:hypothetical protein